MNFSAASFCSGSYAEMVISSTPWERSLASSLTSCGSSARQGAHQVAQKSYTTTLPLWELTRLWNPASSTGTSVSGSGPVANKGQHSKNGIARFIIPPFIKLGYLVNALDR